MEQLLLESLASKALAPAFAEDIGNALARDVIGPLSASAVYPRSLTAANHGLYFLCRREADKLVGAIASADRRAILPGVSRSIRLKNTPLQLVIVPADAKAAGVIQEALPFLRPRVIASGASVGCGDRLGLATPGHVRALAKTRLEGVLCQQSVRENTRTGRRPGQVLADAMWGAWQEGWRQGFGADADHLKTTDEIDAFVDAGYTFFTIDPGDHVDGRADAAAESEIAAMVSALPWETLESRPADLEKALCQKTLELDGRPYRLQAAAIRRAAAKYGRVVAHTVRMYRHLAGRMAARPFDLEVSVDETDTVTSLAEHIYIASELKRLGVRWVSLAPRYVGDFEKGVDYIGDLAAFEASFQEHAAVARTLGPYKLSLHSGSDKFRIYPIAASHTRGLVHLKTAGTSYLEALRTVAMTDPALFRQILALAVARYPADRASYHVSARIEALPPFDKLSDAALPDLLEDFHAREILHVTYGSVLNHPDLRAPLFAILEGNAPLYTKLVAKHFDRHLAPFSRRWE